MAFARLLFFLPLCVQAEQLYIRNARVWTADPSMPWSDAILVDGNRIAPLGRKVAGAREMDAGGKLIIPGFHDAHLHFLSGSLGMSNVDLTGICTLESMQKAVADFAKRHPERPWITGRGWEYFCFPDTRLPTKQDLDAAVSDRPVFLTAYDGHTGWANSKALEKADINRATKFSGYGEIVRDAKTGEATGCLKEGAQALVRKFIPVVTRTEKLEAIRAGLKVAARLGLTSVQNASGDEEELSLYEELARSGELSMRIGFALSVGPNDPLSRADQIAKRKDALKHPLIRVLGVKLMMDGVIENYSAAMLEPYSDRPGEKGSTAWTAEKFSAMAARCDRLGLAILTHAIGDRGVRMTLDGYEHAIRTNGRRDSRFRVEHIETIHPSDVPRFAKLGVMASMEPIHADPDGINVWSKCVGPERLTLAFAWRSLEKSGARVVFSSDWPASISLDPIRGIHNAVNRQTTKGKPDGGWIPDQRVSLETALQGYTTQAAYAAFDEKGRGMIRPGFVADFVALSEDLFRIDSKDIHKTSVEWTVFDGKIIYKK